MPPFQLVAFDLDNTLVDRNEAFRTALDSWGERSAMEPVGLEDFTRRVLELDQDGYKPRAKFCAELTQLLGSDLGSGSHMWEQLKETMLQAIQPDPVVHGLLRNLAQTSELVIVSNGSSAMQRGKLKAAQLEQFFARILISGELGVSKPDAAMFQLLLAGNSPDPAKMLFVGDHPETDIAGARRFGMQTCWVRRNREIPPNFETNFVINTIHEFSEL